MTDGYVEGRRVRKNGRTWGRARTGVGRQTGSNTRRNTTRHAGRGGIHPVLENASALAFFAPFSPQLNGAALPDGYPLSRV